MEERLQKFLSEAGIGSRRKCEEYIKQGKVSINGKTAKIGDKVNFEKDEVCFKKKPVKIENKKIYILLNKPVGYVTTLKDEFGRKKVIDLVKIKQRVVPVGRLDMNTSGALILSNDGEFIYKITHPKHEIKKTYIARIEGGITKEEIEKLQNGVEIEDYITRPARVRLISYQKERNYSEIEIVIHEGKKRQIRKMLKSIGKETIELHRSKIGNLNIEDLKAGMWRYLSKEEIDKLRKLW